MLNVKADFARILGMLSAACLAIAVSACGGGSSNSTSSKPAVTSGATVAGAPTKAGPAGASSTTIRANDPCGYVSVAEVQTATGKTVTGDAVKVNDFSCRYQTSDGGVVNTGVASPVDTARFEQSAQASIGSATLQKIDGLGDKAFAVFSGVVVLKGQTSISVQVSPSPTQMGGDAAIALARLLVERS